MQSATDVCGTAPGVSPPQAQLALVHAKTATNLLPRCRMYMHIYKAIYGEANVHIMRMRMVQTIRY